MNKNELYHYGIPGMKWGKRKSKIEKIEDRSEKHKWSKDATEVEKIKTKKIKQMSNDELSKVKKRSELEKNYKNSTPSKIKKGFIAVGSVASAMGTVIALHSNGAQVMKIGKEVSNKVLNKAGKIVLKNIRL